MLCHCHDDGLMVGSRVDRGELVESDRQTGGDISSELTAGSRRVQAFEEGELLGVADGGLVDGRKLLDDDVGVTLDLALSVEELGSGEVVFLGIDEESCLHVLDLHCDGERGVGLHGSEVLGEREFRRGHVVDGGDDTNWCWVAGACGDLFTVGDGEIGNSQAEVDKVVRRCERWYLTGSGDVLTVICEAGSDDFGIESYMVKRHL